MAAWLTVTAKAVLKAAVTAAKTEFWKQSVGKGAEIVATLVSALIERLRTRFAGGGGGVGSAEESSSSASDSADLPPGQP